LSEISIVITESIIPKSVGTFVMARCKTESISYLRRKGNIVLPLSRRVDARLSARFSIQRALFLFGHASGRLSVTAPSRSSSILVPDLCSPG